MLFKGIVELLLKGTVNPEMTHLYAWCKGASSDFGLVLLTTTTDLHTTVNFPFIDDSLKALYLKTQIFFYTQFIDVKKTATKEKGFDGKHQWLLERDDLKLLFNYCVPYSNILTWMHEREFMSVFLSVALFPKSSNSSRWNLILGLCSGSGRISWISVFIGPYPVQNHDIFFFNFIIFAYSYYMIVFSFISSSAASISFLFSYAFISSCYSV